MSAKRKTLALLGSTGSVGTQTLDVVRSFPDELDVMGLACNRNVELLKKQIDEFSPRFFSCNGSPTEMASLSHNGCQESDLDAMVSHADVDIVVTATIGDVALAPTLAAIECGKSIALANKETVVMAGELVSERAKANSVPLLPMDSEPNAIWQCLRGEDTAVSKLIVTASGGAFRNTPIDRLGSVTPEQALQHPTWKMGQKITVDSATMMNKAFEVIEARWLFGVDWDDIDVVIHPQSVIHSMVEFIDGSVKAQLSPPDMRLPIQYAILYPERHANPSIKRLDPVATGSLTFERWESGRYPCFDLAIEVARRGGTWPSALSGANDAAVELFLAGKIGFMEIGDAIRDGLNGHVNITNPELDDIITACRDANGRVVGLVGA
jgi:1-deoxy-D-xylulose-5-phosphate reductoisomerase